MTTAAATMTLVVPRSSLSLLLHPSLDAARVKNVPRERRKLIKQYKAVAKEREQYKQVRIMFLPPPVIRVF